MSWIVRTDPSGWSTRQWDWASDRSARGIDATMRNTTAAQQLWIKAVRTPDAVALRFDDGTALTFAQIADQVRALAVSFQNWGLRRGDRVSAQLPNWYEFITINLACCALGLVINPIIPIYREAEVSYILKDAGTRVLFIPERYRSVNYVEMLASMRDSLQTLERVVVVRSQSQKSALNAENFDRYEDMLAVSSRGLELPDVAADDVKTVLYTSGTTGNAKGVLHSHNTLARAIDNIAAAYGLYSSDTLFMASPVTHITGYIASEIPFLSDAGAVFMDRWEVSRAVDLIEQASATFSIGATPFLQQLVEECGVRKRTLPSMRHFACGGAAVPPDLIAKAHTVLANCRCYRVYGSTELPLITRGLTAAADERRAMETDGHPSNYMVKVMDARNDELPVGGEGELLIRGPSMMLGYTQPQWTEEAFSADGYFRSGDLGLLTADGDVTVTGRKKDLIIRGGENISAKEIEDVLHAHPAIQEAAVVSMPHERLGEGIVAYLRLKDPGEKVTLEQIDRHIRSSGLARQKTPERIEIIEDFPRTASGKIRKDLLRADIRRRLQGSA